MIWDPIESDISNIRMGELITPEKLALLSVATLATVFKTPKISCVNFSDIRWSDIRYQIRMGELITPERLALLISVATLATVSIASVLVLLFCTR